MADTKESKERDESFLESFHEHMQGYWINTRYILLQYCAFWMLIGLLIGLFVGSAYSTKEQEMRKQAIRKMPVKVYASEYDYKAGENK